MKILYDHSGLNTRKITCTHCNSRLEITKTDVHHPMGHGSWISCGACGKSILPTDEINLWSTPIEDD